jgi:short-subunit dehydrogenase
MTAGGFAMNDIASTSVKELEFQYQLNFLTAYNLVRLVLAKMKEQGHGRIFFIGSMVGIDTNKAKGMSAYGLGKSLLVGLANIINAECEGTAIKAHVIVPNTIDTPQNRAAMPNADFSKWEKPSEIAVIIGKYAQGDKQEQTIVVVQEELVR